MTLKRNGLFLFTGKTDCFCFSLPVRPKSQGKKILLQGGRAGFSMMWKTQCYSLLSLAGVLITWPLPSASRDHYQAHVVCCWSLYTKSTQLCPWALMVIDRLLVFSQQNFVDKLEMWAWSPQIYTSHCSSDPALQTKFRSLLISLRAMTLNILTFSRTFTFYLC